MAEALRHGELLAREEAGDRGVTRDRIFTHLQLSAVCGQLKNPDAASQHLRAARELLAALVRHSPFSPAQWMEWMGLPPLDAAPGDPAAQAGDQTGSDERLQKTAALPMRFVPVPGTAVQFSIYETRVRDFRAFMRETGYVHMRESSVPDSRMMTIDKDGSKARGHTWDEPGFPQTEDHPVVGVSWQDAKAFCA